MTFCQTFRPYPNVLGILVVVESLRQDFVTPQTMPFLSRYQDDSITFSHPTAAANSTHLGWYGLFQSDFPLFYIDYRKVDDPAGSPLFTFLKKAGFKLHVYSDNLVKEYFNSHESYFGKNGILADSRITVSGPSLPENDATLVSRFIDWIASRPQGRHFVVLHLESAHHNYYWPGQEIAPFKPFAKNVIFTKVQYSANEVTAIRNRYLNSIYFLDQKIAHLLKAIRSTGLSDRAYVAVVGDHGEEFREHGAFVHGSNLYNPQLRSAMMFRFPGYNPQRIESVISTMDVLPSMLHAMGILGWESVARGKSFLDPRSRQLPVLATQSRALQHPYEFALCTPHFKLRLEINSEIPAASTSLTVTNIYRSDDTPYVPGSGTLEDYKQFLDKNFKQALAELRLFRHFSD